MERIQTNIVGKNVIVSEGKLNLMLEKRLRELLRTKNGMNCIAKLKTLYILKRRKRYDCEKGCISPLIARS